MKLDITCVRDILLYVEKLPFNSVTNISELQEEYSKYSKEELTYTCLKLIEGGYLDGITISMIGSYLPGVKCITCMTFEGHQLLENIRPETVYQKVRDVMHKVGSSSLDIVTQIAPQFLGELVKTAMSP